MMNLVNVNLKNVGDLTPEEKAIRLQQQLDFLDYIYPEISKRLAELEGKVIVLENCMGIKKIIEEAEASKIPRKAFAPVKFSGQPEVITVTTTSSSVPYFNNLGKDEEYE